MDEMQRNQIQKRLSQSRDALKDAKALFIEGAGLNFVMNNLYYAFLYPVLGFLQARQMPTPMQSTAISLFEREYIQTGIFERRFLVAFRKAFDLRPACGCLNIIADADVEELLPIAQDFLDAVEKNIQQSVENNALSI